MARGPALALPLLGRFLVVSAFLVMILQPAPAAAAADPQVVGEYAVVVSADTGEILYDKGMNVPTAPASLTKIFTAAVALDSAPPDQVMTVDQYDLVGEASMGLSAGEKVSLQTLLYGMLLPSGNDAAMTVAQNLGALPGDTPQQSVDRFMARVNMTAERLGLTGTKLVNPHGLDQAGHQTTARDIAGIMMYALKNEEFRKIIGTSSYSADGHEMYQANQLLDRYPGLIGGKTGITDQAGYSLVEAAQRAGRTVIAVVMKSTRDAWYQDATSLLDFGFGALAARPIDPARPKITLAPAAPAVVPAVTAAETPSTSLAVDRVAETTAVVRSARPLPGSPGFSWRWPVASVVAMAAMLAIVANYPVLLGIGGLALQRRRVRHKVLGGPTSLATLLPPASRRPRRNRGARFGTTGSGSSRTRSRPRAASAVPPSVSVVEARPAGDPTVVSIGAAETYANRAVRLAARGEYQNATAEFVRALRLDPDLDLTRCAGFWTMQPAGYVAAARAYVLIDRPADARTLATVVQLGFGSNRDLERLLRTAGAAV